MPRGGCLCGKIRIAYYGEPNAKVICHCTDCRKISGSTYGVDLLIPTDRFFVTAGDVRKYQKPADSGRILTSHFCGDCGTTLFRECYDDPSAFGGQLLSSWASLMANNAACLTMLSQPLSSSLGNGLDGWHPLRAPSKEQGCTDRLLGSNIHMGGKDIR
ncbi:hypothetical protein V2G26_016609 [Clonostachys chloroleuca]